MVPGRGEERKTRREKHACALYGDQPPLCLYTIIMIGICPCWIPISRIRCIQKEIAEWMGVTPPTVNVSIQRLEKADIVCRKRDDKDQRIMRVYLTENGRKIVEELQQESKAVEKVMFSNFSEAELCLLRRFFGQILDNISEIPVNR